MVKEYVDVIPSAAGESDVTPSVAEERIFAMKAVGLAVACFAVGLG